MVPVASSPELMVSAMGSRQVFAQSVKIAGAARVVQELEERAREAESASVRCGVIAGPLGAGPGGVHGEPDCVVVCIDPHPGVSASRAR